MHNLATMAAKLHVYKIGVARFFPLHRRRHYTGTIERLSGYISSNHDYGVMF
jgi:hypothetical protein